MTTPSSSFPSLRIPAAILAFGIGFAALLLAGPLNDFVKAHHAITVKGYAERHVESDFALWSATITTRGKQITDAAAQMDKSTQAVTDFLAAQGVRVERLRSARSLGRARHQAADTAASR